MSVMQGQCSLFDGEDVIGKEEEKIISIREHKRPVRKKGDRERLIRELPVETVECVLNPEDAVCDICGQEMKVIGKKKVRSEIEFIPAKLVVKKYIQTVYKCPECGKTEEHPDDVIRSAKIPAQVLRHSYASASLVVWIMYQKYMLERAAVPSGEGMGENGAEIKPCNNGELADPVCPVLVYPSV